jgi:transposase InsO family protein
MADLTYIRLTLDFVYLAVILDASSRRVIGWALDRTLEAALILAAFRMALAERRPKPGRVHHSDRGAQYASHGYTQLLARYGIHISMSRKGSPGIVRRASRFSRPSSTKRSTVANIATLPTLVPGTAGSWKKSTNKNACTSRLVTCHRWSSSATCAPKAKRKPVYRQNPINC